MLLMYGSEQLVGWLYRAQYWTLGSGKLMKHNPSRKNHLTRSANQPSVMQQLGARPQLRLASIKRQSPTAPFQMHTRLQAER